MFATHGIVEVIVNAKKFSGVCRNPGNIRKMEMEFPSELQRDMFVNALDVKVLEGVSSVGINRALVYIPT